MDLIVFADSVKWYFWPLTSDETLDAILAAFSILALLTEKNIFLSKQQNLKSNENVKNQQAVLLSTRVMSRHTFMCVLFE